MVDFLLAFLLFFSHARHHERAWKQAAVKSSIQTCDDVSAITVNADWMTLDGCSDGDGLKSVRAVTSGTVTRVVASCWKKERKSVRRVSIAADGSMLEWMPVIPFPTEDKSQMRAGATGVSVIRQDFHWDTSNCVILGMKLALSWFQALCHRLTNCRHANRREVVTDV